MFAIIRTGGKQFKVEKDNKIKVPRLNADEGAKIDLSDVLFFNDGKTATVGSPLVSGAGVTATVIKHYREDKIIVFKKKRRQNYRRRNGHRQDMTLIQITGLNAAKA